MKRGLLVLAALLAVTPPLRAQPEEQELVTDRPDFTESGVTVPRGSVQFEAGFTWEHGNGGGDVLSGPEGLVRWGIYDRLELRLGAPDFIDVEDGASGVGDASVGVKIEMSGRYSAGWNVATILSASLPSGDDDFTSDGVDPGIILALGRDLAPGWSLGTQVAASRLTVDDEHETVLGATAVVGRGLGSRAGAFMEVAAEFQVGGDEVVVLHHGYTFLLAPRVQVDVHGGIGLTDVAPDAFAGAGLSFRL